jgi:hypothetical protein
MRRLPLIAFVLVAACTGADDAYIDDLGFEDLPAGKADGLLDDAPVIRVGDTARGTVGPNQMNVFAIDLKHGQKLTVVQKRTSGNLSPHFTLFLGISTHVSSETFNRTTTKITKTYTAEENARYYIAVKPYQNTGSGSYELSVTCTGDCNGTPQPLDPLDLNAADECVANARECSFAALPSYNGAVGAARSREIFHGCLAAQAECLGACEVEGGAGVCDAIINALPYYADASPACRKEASDCMDTCRDMGSSDWDNDDFAYSNEGICWENGFNGTCDSYARGHKSCSSSGYAEGSNEQCHELCESTSGAWNDDLDTMCTEECD